MARFYAAIAALWIIASDLFVFFNRSESPQNLLLHIAKGLLFVAFSTIALYLYLRRWCRLAEQEHASLRRRLRDWSALVNDVALLVDADGRILEANEKAVQTYGYSFTELTHKNIADLLVDSAGVSSRMRQILQEGELRKSIFHRRADGSTFPAEFNARRVDLPEGPLIQSIVRDMSEHHHAEQQIVRLKDLYAALSQTNQCIVRATNREELFQTICDIAVQFGHFKMAWIGLADEKNHRVVPVAGAGEAIEYLEGLEVSIDQESPLSRGPAGRAILSGKPSVTNSLRDPRSAGPWYERVVAHGMASWAGVPLFLHGKAIGALCLYSGELDYFTNDLTDLLVEMANDISFGLERMEAEAERQRLTAELSESHAWINAIIQGSSEIIAAADRNCVLTLCNNTYRRIMSAAGKPRQIGARIPNDTPVLFHSLERALSGEHVLTEWTVADADGIHYFESRFSPLLDDSSKLIGAVHKGLDVTERKRMELELRKLTTAIEQSPVTIIVTDRDGVIEYVNPAFTVTSGYSASEAIGKTPRILKSGETPLDEYQSMWQTLLHGKSWSGLLQNRRKDGSLYWEEAVIAPVRDSTGEIRQFIGIQQDVTLRRQAEDHARFLASHDQLTRLPNRSVGKIRMEEAIREAEASGGKAALLFLDVDHFKRINDSLGHRIGDRLLQSLVERLKSCLRDIDTLTRIGGDEFLIVLSQLEDTDAIARIADRVREQTSHPFDVDGFELSATLSIGVAIYPDHGITFEELHRQADLAMYSAKKAGRDIYRTYANSMEHEAKEYLLILNGLRRAVDNGEFVLYFQPQIALGTGQIVGAEALIRWNHPVLGLIPPGRFIPIAEDSGLIVEMGNWVIRECCRQAARWQGSGVPELIVAANLSALQFRRSFLDQVVSSALSESNLPPGFLELELTESVLIEDGAHVASTLEQLKEIGVSLALDDFGTGYSSFAYLRNFRLDKLKIDQTFVRNISTNRGDEAIVHSIVQLARNFGLQTIAEGVETEEASHIVHRAGCDMAQGYLFAEPMTSDAFLEFLLHREIRPPQAGPRNACNRLLVL